MTTTRRLPGGEVVILWEAQVSPLGLHSKRWLAHHNEFLPETKPKQVSKSPKIQAMCNVVRRRSQKEYAPRPRLSRMYPWYSVTLHLSMGFPHAPVNYTLDVHFNDSVARAAIVSATKGLRPAGIGLPATIKPGVTSTLYRTSRDMITGGGLER